MSTHHISPIPNTAGAALVVAIVGTVLSTASANSPTTRTVGPRQTISIPARAKSTSQVPTPSVAKRQNSADQPSKQLAGSCRVIDRPKHTIVDCECSSDPLSSVASVDAAAILRLLLGNRTCRAPSVARK